MTSPKISLLTSDLPNQVRTATESNKKLCVDKGWKLYRKKNGEEVKLRHVLEKISTWVTEIIKVVDVGVSFDKSGHAAAPWAVVKYLLTVGSQTTNLANAHSSVPQK
jgi:hypothetical protein